MRNIYYLIWTRHSQCVIHILIERYRFDKTIYAITTKVYNMYNTCILLHSIHGHHIGYPQWQLVLLSLLLLYGFMITQVPNNSITFTPKIESFGNSTVIFTIAMSFGITNAYTLYHNIIKSAKKCCIIVYIDVYTLFGCDRGL